MSIQNWSDDIVLVNLVKEPNISDELQAVTGMVTSKGGFDVVIDFADIEIITSSSISFVDDQFIALAGLQLAEC